ncbi:MAG: dephospho-CoA kinase [Acidobacteria bacterium]|nr:dephospho-CoA kinase [Acidobacteriota bacterium]
MLTGGIATGKSYVLDRFAALGVPTLDADDLARAAVLPEGPAWQGVRDGFGAEMFDERGHLDRPRLGALVFGDAEARARLNALIHPHVRSATTAWFDTLTAPTPFGVVAIPLFYETSRGMMCDCVLVTACAPERQLARLIARGLSEPAAQLRIAAQLPTDEKVGRADHVIWTDGALTDTDRRVEELFGILSVMAPESSGR